MVISNRPSLGLEAPRPPRAGLGPPARADWLILFSLSWKDCLSVAEWRLLGLKGLICTMDKKRYYRWRQKHMQHIRAPGAFLDRRVPVICSGFPKLSSALLAASLSLTVRTHFSRTNNPLLLEMESAVCQFEETRQLYRQQVQRMRRLHTAFVNL